MILPWITIPADDVRIQLPLSIFEGDVKIMFRDTKTIDNTIEQLQNVKALLAEKEAHQK